jgi:hypothetical protein
MTICAVLESLAGVTLVLAPRAGVALLLGAELNRVGLLVGRIGGVALMALGIACWAAKSATDSAGRLGTLRAITFYNFGAGLLLLVSATIGMFHGFVLWSTGVLHLGLAVGLVATRK